MNQLVQELVDTFKPPYKLKDLFSVFIALFVMLTIPLTVLQVTITRDNRSSAAVVTNTQADTSLKVVINSPSESETISGTVSVTVSASDTSVGVTSISLSSNGKVLSTSNNPATSNEFTTKFTWDTTKEPNGLKSLTANASNSVSKTSKSEIVKVNVTNVDIIPPGVSFIQPEDGNYLNSGTTVIKVKAEDNFGVASVNLEIDNNLIKKFTTLPYEYAWDLTSVSTGNHQLIATATDLSGNSSITKIQIYKGIAGLKN